MTSSTFLDPLPAPHKTRRFWMLVALGTLIPLAARLWLVFHGLPPFPLRVELSTGAITFALWVITIWFALRFGRIVWFIVAVFFIGFGLFAMLHSL
jgi:hypothetical protein